MTSGFLQLESTLHYIANSKLSVWTQFFESNHEMKRFTEKSINSYIFTFIFFWK
jgi:hypothetical protein